MGTLAGMLSVEAEQYRRRIAELGAERDDLRTKLAEAEATIESQGRDHDSATCSLGPLCPWCEIATLREQLEDS